MNGLRARKSRGLATADDKRAAIAYLERLHPAPGTATPPPAWVLKEVALLHEVSTRTLYRWWQQRDRLKSDEACTRKRFRITDDHLTAVAVHGSFKEAHEALEKNGAVACSYPTFVRAAQRANPALVQGALHGNDTRNAYTLRGKGSVAAAPHRNHTWHFDFTQADMWVIVDHRSKTPVRPMIGIVTDAFTGMILSVIPWSIQVNGQVVVAMLLDAMSERRYEDTIVGGVPVRLVCDNAAPHFVEEVRNGCHELGIVLAPTAPYTPQSNGQAESALRWFNAKVSNRTPGATKRGKRRDGKPRFSEANRKNMVAEDLLSWKALTLLCRAYMHDSNTRTLSANSKPLTKIEAWAADPTELELRDPALLRRSMMRAARPQTCNKAGFRFDNVDYVPLTPEVHVGNRYNLRYMAGNREFIEVYGLDDEYLGPARPAHRLSKTEARAWRARRGAVERRYLAIEAGATADRQHAAALINAHAEAMEDLGEPRPFDDMVEALDHNVDPLTGEVGSATPIEQSYRTKRPPVPATQVEEPDGNAIARLRSKFGAELESDDDDDSAAYDPEDQS